ncbi:hypothetical protein [Lewinella sp. 4G2]|nr:hypothetical protein [Lewinella sp. 4G2]
MIFEQPESEANEAPPLLGSWRRMYVAVLVAHLALVVFFYLFSTSYA